MAEFFYYLHASGTNYIYPLAPVGFLDPEEYSLLNLNFDNVEEPLTNNSIFNQNTDIPLKYIEELNNGNQTVTEFNFEDIIPFYDSVNGMGNTLYKGKSRLESVRDEIKNIYLATKGKQNKLDLSGITLITPQDRTHNGMSKGLDKILHTDKKGNHITHKQNIEGKFQASGLSKGRSIIVSSTELKAMNLTESLEKIDFDKQRIEDTRTVKRKYGLSENLLPLTDRSEKEKNTEKETLNMIQTAIEPISDNLGSSLSKFFRLKNQLKFDYTHLPAYSIVEKEKSEKENQISEAHRNYSDMVVSLVTNQLITIQQGNEMLKEKGVIL